MKQLKDRISEFYQEIQQKIGLQHGRKFLLPAVQVLFIKDTETAQLHIKENNFILEVQALFAHTLNGYYNIIA